jgi:hypothetical protein
MVALALNTGLIPLAARPARAQKRVAARAAVVPKVRWYTIQKRAHARARAIALDRSRDRPNRIADRHRRRARSTTDDRPDARLDSMASSPRPRRSIDRASDVDAVVHSSIDIPRDTGVSTRRVRECHEG